MGGFFGAVGKRDVVADVFFGTDYHSHLGTKSAGMAAYDPEIGLQRNIHRIGKTPFRSKFEHVLSDMKGKAAIGSLNDTDPQPLLIRSKLGAYALCSVGVVTNAEALAQQYLEQTGGHFDAMTGGKVNSNELIAALINQRDSFVDGIRYVQDSIEGSASILILKNDGTVIAARDKFGRLPVLIGEDPDGFCVTFESFAYRKLGYVDHMELGPGEIVELSAGGKKGG